MKTNEMPCNNDKMKQITMKITKKNHQLG